MAVEVLQSNRPVSHKVLWCVLVFICKVTTPKDDSGPVADAFAVPIIGIIIYWLFSNREAHKPNAGYEPIG